MSCVGTAASLATTRKTVDKSGGQEAKVGQKQVARGDEHADGWTWSGEHVHGLWKTPDWQTGTGSGWWTTANDWTLWEPEEPVGGFEINGTERCWSKTPRRGTEQRVRRWQRPRREEGARDQEATHSSSATVEMNAPTKKGQTVISPTPTEQRVMVPPEKPHDTRTCIEDDDFDESGSRELREMQDECRRWDAQTEATWVKDASTSLKRDFSGPTYGVGGIYPDGEVLTMDEWKQLCVKVDRLEGDVEHETEKSSSAYDESYADNECEGTDINGETLYQEPSKKRAWIAHHLFAGGRQVHVDDTMDLSAPDTEVATAGDWMQALEEFEDENDCENSSDDSDGSETNDVRCTVPRTASTAKATKIRPDEHWNCVVGTARFSKFQARQQR